MTQKYKGREGDTTGSVSGLWGWSVPAPVVQGQREWDEEGGREKEREKPGSLPATSTTARWSSANMITQSSDAGWWHWTQSTIPLGSLVMNCSSATM